MKKEIINHAKEAGLNEVEEADVSQVLEFHAGELVNLDLKQLEMQRTT